ncbi:hypothetical protein FOA43_004657 [Brettanomyces nanus]|uniref:Uncharacterized protein n=1 Tax=Eeniella nana TaxID=13502 RepID=A0A875RQK2_EENNA|nr:uncharacterized protein FOA43_004657 [Brettanomyces nanus]QPG77250.1 hypothetical protein FOA43_004657 [Brettanomyces nanus]
MDSSPISQSLLSLLDGRNNIISYSSGVTKLDSALLGGKGFQPSLLYDINCVPGSVGKWELIFHLVLECLELQKDLKILIIQAANSIPWFKLTRQSAYSEDYKRRVQVIGVQSLAELMILLQNMDHTEYSLVVIDEFQGLYQACRMDIKRHAIRGRKRDALGNLLINPIKKLDQAMADVLMMMTAMAKRFGTLYITTGKLEVFNQRIKQDELVSDDDSAGSDDDETSDGSCAPKFFIQRILVPILPLPNYLSDFYANRIILYNDWLVGDPSDATSITSGLDKSVSINDYIRLLELKNMKVSPHFLCMSNNANRSEQKPFVDGWFQVEPDTFSLVDSEADLGLDHPLKTSTQLPAVDGSPRLSQMLPPALLRSTQLGADEIPDSQS